jgi:hypothetical protein
MPPRDLGGIISSAFAIYRKNAGPLAAIVAVVVVPLSLLSFLITYLAFAPAHKTVVTAPTTSSLVVQPRSGVAGLFAGLIAIAIGAVTSAILRRRSFVPPPRPPSAIRWMSRRATGGRCADSRASCSYRSWLRSW